MNIPNFSALFSGRTEQKKADMPALFASKQATFGSMDAFSKAPTNIHFRGSSHTCQGSTGPDKWD
jgi:hypothetical protein